ncbi:MAG TPA: sigma-54-dependent Fis family transcriptional regulator [Terriglobia bacterium]|nr:sigma-54-dependent Fis family transcriptional regulator [Terriglobia bacterium]
MPHSIQDTEKGEPTEFEQRLRLLIDHVPTLIWTAAPDGSIDFINQRGLEYHGVALPVVRGWGWTAVIHPEDLTRFVREWRAAVAGGKPFEGEARLRRADGAYRWFLSRGVPLRDELGDVIRWYGTTTDIEDRKQAEDAVARSEDRLRLVIDTIPALVGSMLPDGSVQFINRRWLEYAGLFLEDVQGWAWTGGLHPDDRAALVDSWRAALAAGTPWEGEGRLRRADGAYRRFLLRTVPLRDEAGNTVRWYATGYDIEELKRAEDALADALNENNKLKEQLQRENLALKEEIDRSSMFEEIVGAAPALRAVLANIANVAPSDCTVLITGETGTGKELIARAIHKRSERAGRAFVSVNCAAIPPSLISSELFGHEKGAFTGAVQRRLGRFELAEGGTIFLDEIGDLPAETQVALLRVLQEREFERVGGEGPIAADVRVIAATNRDLAAAMSAGAFRSDLFYRLNVFPLQVPPLRERKEDIPLLVEYFVHRFASKAGKKIRVVSKTTLQLLQSYPWPGNIRELQNVIERSVIVSAGESLIVDEKWLSGQSLLLQPVVPALPEQPQRSEREVIEAALAESSGRVSGPRGAAAKLGVPPSTLEWRIKSLKIDKYRFKVV